MKKQQGFSVENILLALVITTLISAAIIPTLVNAVTQYTTQGNVLQAVDRVFYSMNNALNDAWTISTKKNADNITLVKCRSAPILSVNKLISQYQLNKNITSTLNHLSIAVEDTHNIETNMRVSFLMPSIKDAVLINRYLS